MSYKAVDWHTFNRSEVSCHVRPYGFGPDYPDADNFLRVFVSSASPWDDDTYNALVEKARRALDQDERMKLYHEVDKILMEAAAIVPLAYIQWHNLVKPWVRSKLTDLLSHRWKDVVIEQH